MITMFEDIMFHGLLLIVSFMLTYLIMPPLIKYLNKKGIQGVDVHKLEKPKVAEMGGLGLVIGVTITTLLAMILFPSYFMYFLSFLIVYLLVAIIGIVDDLKTLGPKMKPLLILLASLPLIFTGVVYPKPRFPIVGETRLTIAYWPIVPLTIAVTSNAANMIDVFNGALSGTAVIIFFVLFIASLLMGSEIGAILSLIMFGATVAYYLFNKYPAKTFSGDTGSLTIGAAIGLIAILGRVEVAALVALIPYIMNSYHSLASIGRLFERHQLKARPVYLLDDGRLKASDDPRAPLTLTRLLLVDGPLHEYEIVKYFIILTTISGIFAILTVLLIPGVIF